MPTINTIRELCRLKQYEAALLEIESLEKVGATNAQLLILKARCFQETQEQHGFGATEAESTLMAALEMDSECVEALTELGWFYLKYDQAEQAMWYFERAFETANEQLSRAATGVAKCLHEVWGPDDALRYLERVRDQAVDEMALELIQEEFKDF